MPNFRMYAREAEPRSPAPVFLECAGGARERGLRPSRVQRLDRRVRRLQHQHLLPRARVPRPAHYRKRSRATTRSAPIHVAGAHEEFPGHTSLLQAGFEGPSITLSTACSTSAAGRCPGCQSLILGQSDMALAGESRSPSRRGAATSTRRAAWPRPTARAGPSMPTRPERSLQRRGRRGAEAAGGRAAGWKIIFSR